MYPSAVEQPQPWKKQEAPWLPTTAGLVTDFDKPPASTMPLSSNEMHCKLWTSAVGGMAVGEDLRVGDGYSWGLPTAKWQCYLRGIDCYDKSIGWMIKACKTFDLESKSSHSIRDIIAEETIAGNSGPNDDVDADADTSDAVHKHNV